MRGAPMATEGRAGAQGGRVRARGERLVERVLAGGTCTATWGGVEERKARQRGAPGPDNVCIWGARHCGIGDGVLQ